MDDLLLLDVIERYLRNELNPQEKEYFENLRKDTPEVDQMVVEHSLFLQQMNTYGDRRHFKHDLHTIHQELVEKGEISEAPPVSQGKVISIWRKYRKVTAIAATIAGITAILVSVLVVYLTPSQDPGIRMLGRQIQALNHNLKVQGNQINEIKSTSKIPVNERPVTGGTGFLIDGAGYLVTNAHVVKGASTIWVQSVNGGEYKTVLAHLDAAKDLAILKIEDEDYKPIGSLPYSIRNSNVDLGEQIFTLGYPRDEIVYNEGYLSAKTGYNGDTLTCQIAVSANPGNSGGPILNKNGEVIGVLSTAQQNAEGVVFAIKSKHIFNVIDDLKNEDATAKVKLPSSSAIKGMNRVQQIKKMEDCVFMVRSFTK